ncbi:MAG: hypothetical protein PVJ86_06495 [Phycisphaerales bacterium]
MKIHPAAEPEERNPNKANFKPLAEQGAQQKGMPASRWQFCGEAKTDSWRLSRVVEDRSAFQALLAVPE